MGVLDMFLPPACAGCQRSGRLLCASCLADLRPPSSPEDRFAVPDAGVVIGSELVLALAAFVYEGPLRKALAGLKYGGVARLAPVLAEAAGPTLLRLATLVGPAPLALVPVPVHEERRRERGYNQAELLANELGRTSGHRPEACLVRVRATVRQHRLNRSARLHNLRDAFEVRSPPPPTAILVDDIITTSATLEACASVLRQAGCGEVYGFAIAREV